MKNFGTLYRYELKKLLKRKLSWVVVLLVAAFGVYTTMSRGIGFTGIRLPVFDENGNETGELYYISGEEMYDTYMRTVGELDGQVMDEAFFQKMLAAVPGLDFSKPAPFLTQNLYFWQEDATYGTPYGMVRALFEDPKNVTAEEFYMAQREETGAYLERLGLSRAEKDYWMEQAAHIQTPYIYVEPWGGASQLFNCAELFVIVLPAAVAVCLCTAFSEDRRKRVDALVFSTRESRVPLYLAKALAGLTVTVLSAVLVVGSAMAALVCIWGWRGFDAPVQLFDVYSPRPITVGQAVLPMLLLSVLFAVVYGGLTMLISVLTKNPLAALAGPVIASVLIGKIQFPQDSALRNYCRDNLLRYGGLPNLHLLNIFGVPLNSYQFGPLLYLTVTAFLLALCWLCWRQSAKGRL